MQPTLSPSYFPTPLATLSLCSSRYPRATYVDTCTYSFAVFLTPRLPRFVPSRCYFSFSPAASHPPIFPPPSDDSRFSTRCDDESSEDTYLPTHLPREIEFNLEMNIESNEQRGKLERASTFAFHLSLCRSYEPWNRVSAALAIPTSDHLPAHPR